MTIKKFTGSTKDEAIAAAKEQLGDRVVIMNTREKKAEGVFGFFKKGVWEVTVAIEEDEIKPALQTLSTSTFTAVADEKIDLGEPVIPQIQKTTPIEPVAPIRYTPPVRETIPTPSVLPSKAKEPKPVFNELDLKSAFKEVSRVIENTSDGTLSKDDYKSNIIKKDEFIEKQEAKEAEKTVKPKRLEENRPLIKMVYNTLIDNEVDEKYINEILGDMGNIFAQPNSLDYFLYNIYQKMVLKLGKVSPIALPAQGPLVVFFVGPTGVGKTTTIAKIASEFCINQHKKVGFVAADTYRIAAAEQLTEYANILGSSINVIVEPGELNQAVESLKNNDLILVDTFGFSHKNEEQKANIKALIDALDSKYKSQVYLVNSVTTKYQDLKDIVDSYKEICDYKLIFTKLDETSRYGNILNIKLHTDAELSYMTNGQNVPDDISVINLQKLVKSLLKGK